MTVFLETKRLILRNLTFNDVNDLTELDSNPEVMRYINGGIATSREAVANDFLPYTISYYKKFNYTGLTLIPSAL